MRTTTQYNGRNRRGGRRAEGMMKGGHSEEGGEVPMKVPMGAGECQNWEGRTHGVRTRRPI